MSVFNAYQIGTLGSGFTNQFNSLINELIDAEVHHRPLLILGKFRTNYNTDSMVPLWEIIDMDDLQQQVGDKLRLYLDDEVKLEFIRGYYGTYADGKDVTAIITDKFWNSHTRTLHITKNTNLNSVLGDPIPGQVKTLYLEFKIGDTTIHVEHSEHISEDVLHAITAVPARFNRPNLVYQETYERYLRSIVFHPALHTKAQVLLKQMDLSSTVNLIHVRNEPDALHFWGGINGIVPYAFGKALNTLYETLITQHCDPNDDIVVLTSTPDNPVCQFLKDHGYHYHIADKVEGHREVNAIIDLLISRACTGTFIGNLNPETKRGSTFDNPVWKRLCSGVKCVFIDLDHVNEPVHICTTT